MTTFNERSFDGYTMTPRKGGDSSLRQHYANISLLKQLEGSFDNKLSNELWTELLTSYEKFTFKTSPSHSKKDLLEIVKRFIQIVEEKTK